VVSAKASNVASSNVASSEASHVTAAEASHVASAEATHVTAAEATHMTSAAAAVSSAPASAGLRPSGKKAAGKHRACQNHHHSSFHDILLLDGRMFRHMASSDASMCREGKRQRRNGLKMAMLVFVSTKFPFNHPD
jgi:hypothetical protein